MAKSAESGVVEVVGVWSVSATVCRPFRDSRWQFQPTQHLRAGLFMFRPVGLFWNYVSPCRADWESILDSTQFDTLKTAVHGCNSASLRSI